MTETKEARKPRLIATQGVPGSGKSTWAAEQRGFLVVNQRHSRRHESRA